MLGVSLLIAIGLFAVPKASSFGMQQQEQQPDNTRMNKGDASKDATTADQQKMNPNDREMSRKIRAEIMKDKSLSTYAHNVKVITQDGKVTLKGPVRSQDEKASAELSTAVRTFETPVRPAGVPPQPGTDTFASLQERATTARKQFQAIVDKYPHTHTADMARYFVGLASSQLGDYAAAEHNLQETAAVSNADLAALGKFALASVYRAENKDAQAIDIYKQLIDKPSVVVGKATAQMELASLYGSQNKLDDARKLYDQVAKDNPSTRTASLAQHNKAGLK